MTFAGNPENTESIKRKAKLYTEIYPYAAEDFVNYQNMQQWILGLYSYIRQLEMRIFKVTQVLNTHTHKVAPHIHNIQPHTHISATPGNPTSPNIGGFATLPNVPIEGLLSTQQPSIVWNQSQVPQNMINTTGAITNMVNAIGLSQSSVESDELGVQKARQVKPPILLTPSIPQYIGIK